MNDRRFEGKDESGTRIFMWGIVLILLFMTLLLSLDYMQIEERRVSLVRLANVLAPAPATHSITSTHRIVVDGDSMGIVISGNVFVPDADGECGVFITSSANVYIANNLFE